MSTLVKNFEGIGIAGTSTKYDALALRAEKLILPHQKLILASAHLITAFIMFLLAGTPGMAGAIAAGAISLAVHTLFTRLKQREVLRLVTEIEDVLHAGHRTTFSDCREGHMALLRNEIAKMTSRLQRTAEQLEHEKTALADALADLSHQIRTPLTAIQLMVPVIERTREATERTHKLHELETMVDRVSWLVTTLLKLAKFDSGALAVSANVVSLTTAVRAAIKPFEIAFDMRGITCNVMADANITFRGDTAWTIEALSNLVKNCMEHTPAGGEVAVQVTEDTLAVRIRITDTGEGIHEEDAPYLFERFYRGTRRDTLTNEQKHTNTPASPGFGLGLSLAQSCISAQGGTLRAFNRTQGGACFEVTFPKLTV